MGSELIIKIVNAWWADYTLARQGKNMGSLMFGFNAILSETFSDTPFKFAYDMKNNNWKLTP